MTAVGARWRDWWRAHPRTRGIVFDVLAVAVAAADAWWSHWWALDWESALIILGVVALAGRRRWPLLVFIATLPTAMALGEMAAPLIALFTLASRVRSRSLIAVCTVVLGGFTMWPWGLALPWGPEVEPFVIDSWWLVSLAYILAPPAAAAFLGQLVQMRRELSRRLDEITEVREHEQVLATQKVLSEERAQLAREMHDVVSHQVSLIAVRAGALQVSTGDDQAREAAADIRSLSVRTLDELRHMVNVLRAGGGRGTELVPQPTLDQLDELVFGSGVEASLRVGELPDLEPPHERAIYRTVQEGLTNARKHAPGAAVEVTVDRSGSGVAVAVVNAASQREAMELPSARHGLLGLRQRAELLGGTLEWGPTDQGGWRIDLRLPV